MAGRKTKPKYWLFMIMYDWVPESWQAMVERGIAAQQYPEVACPNDARNRAKLLGELKKGDWIVATFGQHRFAGYGKLTSAFRDSGPSLRIRHPDGSIYDFWPRARCQWTVIPFELDRPYISCADLRDKVQTRLSRGLCVREVDRASFLAIKARLDKAGAKPLAEIERIAQDSDSDLEAMTREEEPLHPAEEGTRRQGLRNYWERDPRNRRLTIQCHGTTCEVCGFNFQEAYGPSAKHYIEVHHIRPLSAGGKRRPDPRKDMAVLCANCHRMIHCRNIPTLAELRRIIRYRWFPGQGARRVRSKQ